MVEDVVDTGDGEAVVGGRRSEVCWCGPGWGSGVVPDGVVARPRVGIKWSKIIIRNI